MIRVNASIECANCGHEESVPPHPLSPPDLMWVLRDWRQAGWWISDDLGRATCSKCHDPALVGEQGPEVAPRSGAIFYPPKETK